MDNKPQDKWYFRTPTLITAFLCVGPFVLPLVWFNPRFSLKVKIIITAIVIIFSYYLAALLLDSLKSINKYYRTIF